MGQRTLWQRKLEGEEQYCGLPDEDLHFRFKVLVSFSI